MILRKAGQVIVSAALYADEGDHAWIECLQFFAVADGDEPVAGAVQDIGMTVYMLYPFIGTQVITQHVFYGEDRQKTFDGFFKTEIRCIQNQVAGFVIAGELTGKAAAQASSVHDQVVFRETGEQVVVYKLHVVQHCFFIALAGAFAKTPVIHQHHIIIIPVKIFGITGPALDAAGIAVKVKDETFGIFPEKMKAVDPDPRFNIKKVLPEGYIIFENKVLF